MSRKGSPTAANQFGYIQPKEIIKEESGILRLKLSRRSYKLCFRLLSNQVIDLLRKKHKLQLIPEKGKLAKNNEKFEALTSLEKKKGKIKKTHTFTNEINICILDMMIETVNII